MILRSSGLGSQMSYGLREILQYCYDIRGAGKMERSVPFLLNLGQFREGNSTNSVTLIVQWRGER
jgi:hypothetical protein